MDLHIKTSEKDEYPRRKWARMINSLSGFKSANLIGTINKAGHANLCIVSSVVHIGARPPLMAFVLRPHASKSPRHTILNLKECPFFTINHIGHDFHEKAHQTSAKYSREVSEFEACDLLHEFKGDFKAPFVGESRLQIGLELKEIVDITLNNTHLVIGEILEFYLPQVALMEDGYIDIEALSTVCISGLDGYHSTDRISRLAYAEPDKATRKISVKGDILGR